MVGRRKIAWNWCVVVVVIWKWWSLEVFFSQTKCFTPTVAFICPFFRASAACCNSVDNGSIPLPALEFKPLDMHLTQTSHVALLPLDRILGPSFSAPFFFDNNVVGKTSKYLITFSPQELLYFYGLVEHLWFRRMSKRLMTILKILWYIDGNLNRVFMNSLSFFVLTLYVHAYAAKMLRVWAFRFNRFMWDFKSMSFIVYHSIT